MTADPRPRRSYRALLVAALTALAGAHAASACSSNCAAGACTDSSDALLINQVCKLSFKEGPACELGKGALKSTGITGDTIGFHLGDQGGTLSFHLDALDGVRRGNTFDVELLVASTDPEGTRLDATLDWGSCATGCQPGPPIFDTTVTPDYHWVPVVIGQPSAQTTGLPYDAVLRVTGKSIDIADLRVSSISPEFACSLARPLGAR